MIQRTIFQKITYVSVLLPDIINKEKEYKVEEAQNHRK